MEQKIRKFIGVRAEYDKSGQMIWAVSKNDGLQQLLDLRGWGAIQNLFNAKYGTPEMEAAENFQDALGEWIADAINQKLSHLEELDSEIERLKELNNRLENKPRRDNNGNV